MPQFCPVYRAILAILVGTNHLFVVDCCNVLGLFLSLSLYFVSFYFFDYLLPGGGGEKTGRKETISFIFSGIRQCLMRFERLRWWQRGGRRRWFTVSLIDGSSCRFSFCSPPNKLLMRSPAQPSPSINSALRKTNRLSNRVCSNDCFICPLPMPRWHQT